MEDDLQKGAIPRRVLVRTPNWIGDHVMARQFYRGLRLCYPFAHMTFLSTEPVFGMEDADLCDEKILLPKEAKHFGKAMLCLSREIKNGSFDLALSLPATLNSALLFFLSSIPHRVGFLKDGNQVFLTAGLQWKGRAANVHKSLQYLSLLEYLRGAPFFLAPETLPSSVRESLVVVAPGASIPLREWPYYEQLLQELSLRCKRHRIVVVGSHAERGWHERLQKLQLPGVEDWIEKTSLAELVALLKKAEIVVANDSGVAHLSATLAGTPTLVLFGPGDPHYIAPSGDTTCLRISLPCSPCEKPYCRAVYGYQTCLKNLELQHVLQETLRRIGFDTQKVSS